MKLSKNIQRVFASLLLVAWCLFAILNGVFSAPHIGSAYKRMWGGTAEKLAASVEAANGQIVFQDALQDAAGSIRSVLNKQLINGFSLVQGADGQLSYTNFYPYALLDYDEPAQKVQQLSLAAERQGASFLYLNCIDLYDEEHNVFGDLPANNFNPRSNAFLYALRGYSVDTLDARALLKASSLDRSQYLYKTEPHWTVQACFEVFRTLVETLQKQGSQIDPEGFFTDSTNYLHTLYPQSYLGKMGKMAGATYSGYDDFTLIEPNFRTDFTISYSLVDNRDDVRGDFSDTILDAHWMESDNPYENDMYCSYLSENYAYRKITNNLLAEGPRILVVGDSYMLPVTAFLATSASEIVLLSPYSLPEGITNLVEYLDTNAFDHVIVGLNPGTLHENGWNFLTGIELP
ncbi:hypothetical protein LJC74_04430 [Eubacteriales bacterium OttesenSCG-928-A19]|nr:hypothetical protein [Eubacteriales bacterium OttesenSCG-928-A19]